MELRRLSKSGIHVSALGFGCGAVGGLMVRGDRTEMVRTVARAVEAGITYFDTAAIYGDGRSETNLGSVLQELKPDVVVGTKVRLAGADLDEIPAAVERSVAASLQRLQMDSVDLIQLHNPVAGARNDARDWITPNDVAVAGQTLQGLVERGLAKAWGINGLGETDAIHAALVDCGCDSIQCCYNLLNPTAIEPALQSFPFQDYRQLAQVAAEKRTHVIAIRILAGGALSGSRERHRWAANRVDPIATSPDYIADVESAQRFQKLVDDGKVESLVEAAIRFAVYSQGITTALIGISSYEQLEQAIRFTERGPLDEDTLVAISAVQELA